MAEDSDREFILQAVKERVRQSEELQLTQMIVDAIGERRYRDLSDLVSQIEQDRGWPAALIHLSRANQISYTLPIGAGPNKTLIEDLKYREMIFAVLECTGFEPIPMTTEEILSNLENENSLIDASQSLHDDCETLIKKQIESGDTLFFDLNNTDSSIQVNTVDQIEQIQRNELTNLSLEKHGDTINILPLWYSEKGRQTLSQLGVKGISIDPEVFDIVISVIQQEIATTNTTKIHITEESMTHPSNPQYRELLNAIINQDIESMSSLSSKHSFHTLKFLLEDALDYYENSQSSSAFRKVLSCVNAHIRVRTPESVMLFENLAHSKDTRISTTAIAALGNFYYESSASALVDLLCTTKNKEVANTTIRAITNISKRCFETKYIVKNAAESPSCTNIGHLKRLNKAIWKKIDDYYL